MSFEICQVLDLVQILKSAEEYALDLFMDLLDLICQRFSPEDSSQDAGQFVRLKRSSGSQESSAVSVSPYGFQLLEAGK